MSGRHWQDDDLIAHLYGAGPEDGHLSQCEECAGRWRALQATRQRLLASSPVSEAELLRQRENVYRRAAQPERRRPWLTLAPVAAVLAVVVLAVVLRRPWAARVPEPTVSDAALYEQVYALSQTEEPEAVSAVRALFDTEVNQ